MSTLTLAVKSIKSITESSGLGSDEPYVLVTAAKLSGVIPQLEVTLYGPWSDVDEGETHGTLVLPKQLLPEDTFAGQVVRQPFWGLDNVNAAPIAHPDEVVFIVSVMENDGGDPHNLRSFIKLAAIASLAASSGMTRAVRVRKLINDIGGIMGTITGVDFDEPVGLRELPLTAANLVPPAAKRNTIPLIIRGGSEGSFQVDIEFVFNN
ncbi:MAG TPA: hypothetical protein VIN08_19680 [Ohtaekwangia sp.]|uniref:hypothetical protein n=1 Tax=Ohtaekwangia sp. TaxID=2066019 RepID=UPI002F95010A